AGPVVGGPAAAVRLDDLDRGSCRDVQLARVGPAAERDHRRMLEEDRHVRDRALRDRPGQGALEIPGLLVWHESEFEEISAGGHWHQPNDAYHSCMRSIALLVMATALSLAGTGSASVSSGLRGVVMRGPVTPVCVVGQAMVVREGQVHDRANRDHVLTHVVLDDPRALDDCVGTEDRGLWLADHRRAVERSVAAGVRDRERAALNLVRQELLVPRT